jgi:anaerobic selenocysteine-containing dehydrogenase
VQSGGRVRVITKRASAETVVEVTDTMLPGHVALPNGTGLWYPDRRVRNSKTALRRMSSRQVSIATGSRARRSTSTFRRGLNA